MGKKRIYHVINSQSWVVRERVLAIAGKVEWASTKDIGIMEIKGKVEWARDSTKDMGIMEIKGK